MNRAGALALAIAVLAAVTAVLLLAGQPWAAALLVGLLAGAGAWMLLPRPRDDDAAPLHSGRPSGRALPQGRPATGAPRRRRSSGITGEELEAQARLLQDTVAAHRSSIPNDAHEPLTRSLMLLRQAATSWDGLSRATEQREALEGIAFRYLPGSLESFLGLPDVEKPRVAREWTGQLQDLEQGIRRALSAAARQDIAQLRTQGELLSQRFGDPDERLFREHGL